MQTRDNNYEIFTLAFYLTKVNLSIRPGNEPIICQFKTINPTYTQKGIHYLVRVSSLSNQNGRYGEPGIVKIDC